MVGATSGRPPEPRLRVPGTRLSWPRRVIVGSIGLLLVFPDSGLGMFLDPLIPWALEAGRRTSASSHRSIAVLRVGFWRW